MNRKIKKSHRSYQIFGGHSKIANKTGLNDILYVNKCYCIGSAVAVEQLHLYFLSGQITHKTIIAFV